MRAFTFDFKNMFVSINHDIITVYPKFTKLKEKIDIFSSFMTAEGQAFSDFLRLLTQNQLSTFEVPSKHGSHKIGHQDEISIEKDTCNAETAVNHNHLKFNNIFDRNLLKTIFDIACAANLVGQGEVVAFLQAFDEMNEHFISNIEKLGMQSFEEFYRSILTTIAGCDNNFSLAMLNDFLANQYFNELNITPDEFANNSYFGTNRDGEVVPVGKCWAMIQEAISLQMLYNVHLAANHLTPELAEEIIEKFSRKYSFFALHRQEGRQENENFISIFLNSHKTSQSLCMKDLSSQLADSLMASVESQFRLHHEVFFAKEGIKIPIYRIQKMTEGATNILTEIKKRQQKEKTDEDTSVSPMVPVAKKQRLTILTANFFGGAITYQEETTPFSEDEFDTETYVETAEIFKRLG